MLYCIDKVLCVHIKKHTKDVSISCPILFILIDKLNGVHVQSASIEHMACE